MRTPLLACLGQYAVAFVVPHSNGVTSRALWILPATKASASRRGALQLTAESSLDSTNVDIRGKLREAIWSATDAIDEAAKDARVGHGKREQSPLESLGKALMALDDKYFSQYNGVTPTAQYLETLSPSETAAQGGASPPGDETVNKAAAVIQDAAKDLMTAEASAAVAVKEIVTAATDEAAAVSAAVAPPAKKEGGVDLQRPDKVQNVFDELQKAAVSLYKDAVGATAPTATAVEAAAPGASRAILEGKLEALLEENAYSPAAMPAAQKQQLVGAILALEAAYPQGAAPLADPALSGQWSLVYSSRGGIFKAMLGRKRSKLVKVSSPLQAVDASKTAVTNSCDLRLRFTPFKFAMKQEGTYRPLGATDVEVSFRRGRLGRLLAPFRKGTVSAAVTYVSDAWRISRSDGCVCAFRKVSVDEA